MAKSQARFESESRKSLMSRVGVFSFTVWGYVQHNRSLPSGGAGIFDRGFPLGDRKANVRVAKRPDR